MVSNRQTTLKDDEYEKHFENGSHRHDGDGPCSTSIILCSVSRWFSHEFIVKQRKQIIWSKP